MPKKVVMKKKVIEKMPRIVIKPNLKPNISEVASKTPKILVTKKVSVNPQKVKKENIEKILVENFVSLQKVMVNLSVKMDNLANQVSQLLNLFEISARSLADKGANLGGGYEKRILEKIDNIVDQNKTMARGISLLHEPETSHQNFVPSQSMPSQVRQAPQGQMQPPAKTTKTNMEGYQQSISSEPQDQNA